MDIDFSLFDDVYDTLARSIVHRLTKKFIKYSIKIEEKKYVMEDIVKIYINNNIFEFDMSTYIEKSLEFGEINAFNDLTEKISTLLN